jgi:hypothetical protein
MRWKAEIHETKTVHSVSFPLSKQCTEPPSPFFGWQFKNDKSGAQPVHKYSLTASILLIPACLAVLSGFLRLYVFIYCTWIFALIGADSSLQMKRRWESKKMSGSDLCIPRNETARYFQNIIIMFCLLISTFMYPWAIVIFPGLVCLFWCSQIGRPTLGMYKSLTDTWM